MGSIEILEDVSFRVTLKNWGSKWQCHFVDSDLKVEKEGKTEYGEIDFEMKVQIPAAY